MSIFGEIEEDMIFDMAIEALRRDKLHSEVKDAISDIILKAWLEDAEQRFGLGEANAHKRESTILGRREEPTDHDH